MFRFFNARHIKPVGSASAKRHWPFTMEQRDEWDEFTLYDECCENHTQLKYYFPTACKFEPTTLRTLGQPAAPEKERKKITTRAQSPIVSPKKSPKKSRTEEDDEDDQEEEEEETQRAEGGSNQVQFETTTEVVHEEVIEEVIQSQKDAVALAQLIADEHGVPIGEAAGLTLPPNARAPAHLHEEVGRRPQQRCD